MGILRNSHLQHPDDISSLIRVDKQSKTISVPVPWRSSILSNPMEFLLSKSLSCLLPLPMGFTLCAHVSITSRLTCVITTKYPVHHSRETSLIHWRNTRTICKHLNGCCTKSFHNHYLTTRPQLISGEVCTKEIVADAFQIIGVLDTLPQNRLYLFNVIWFPSLNSFITGTLFFVQIPATTFQSLCMNLI